MENDLPYLDVAAYGLGVPNEQAKALRSKRDDSLKTMAKNMISAIEKYSFCVLLNSGVDRQKLLNTFEAVAKFIDTPSEDKDKYEFSLVNMHGWMKPFIEKFGSAPKTDLDEAYVTVGDPRRDGIDWPDKLSPELRPTFQALASPLLELSMRMLDVMSIGLELEDVEHLRKITDVGPDHFCPWRFNNFRPLKPDDVLKPGEMRFGDHTDGGTFTMVFPENGSGLQRLLDDGTWQDIPYSPGMVLLFVGDTVEYITCGRFKAITHRVKVPDGPDRYLRRFSLALFLYPYKDAIIGPIDGSVNEKYPPVESHKISLAGYYDRYREDEYTAP